MDLEEKSQTIVEIEKLKSTDGRSPRHTESVGTKEHRFDLQTRGGHILKIRVCEGTEENMVSIDSSTVSIEDGIRSFDHSNPRDRLDEVVGYVESFLSS